MSDDVLDLLARAPAPVMHLDPGVVISAAKRTKRRQRVLTVGTGLVVALVVALVVGGTSVLADGGPHTQDAIPAGHPLATAPTTSSPMSTPTVVPSEESDPMWQTWGPVHVMSQQQDRKGGRPVLYLTPTRMLCIGTVDAVGDVSPSECRPINAPPSDGFGTGYAWSMEGDLPAGVKANEFIAGVVAGDVTKVVARTERGDLTAQLAPAPDPELGQLYWVETRVPILSSATHARERSRIAYRGAKVAFTCAYYECVRE